MTAAYPLTWPQWRPRKLDALRKRGKFNSKHSNGKWMVTNSLSVAEAISRLQRELDTIGAQHAVLSTNVETRLDGLPRSGQPEPRDPGAALYFMLSGKQMCMPCDTYDRVADNIAAIAAHIEATRAIERYGVQTLDEAFTGFMALPAPKAWHEVLGVKPDATHEQINAAWREKCKTAHPDKPGGSHDAMATLNAARQEGLR